MVGGPLHVDAAGAGRRRRGSARRARRARPSTRRAPRGTSTPPRTGPRSTRRTGRRRARRPARSRRCAPSPARAAGRRPSATSGVIQRPSRDGSAQRATTSSKAVSTRTSKRSQRLAQRAAHLQRTGRDDAARVGRPPPHRAAAVRAQAHGEQPEAVGREQGARLEVGPGRDEVVTGVGAGGVEQPGGARAARPAGGPSRCRGRRSVVGAPHERRDLLGGVVAVGRRRRGRRSRCG